MAYYKAKIAIPLYTRLRIYAPMPWNEGL